MEFRSIQENKLLKHPETGTLAAKRNDKEPAPDAGSLLYPLTVTPVFRIG